MDTAQLIENLNKLPLRQLITAMRFLNGGPLGYDYMKKTKADLQANAVHLALRYAHATHPGEGFEATLTDVIEALKNDKRVTGTDGSIGSVLTKAQAVQKIYDALTCSGEGTESAGEAADGLYGGGEGDEEAKQRAGDGDGSHAKKHKSIEGGAAGNGEGGKPEDGKGKGKGDKGDKGEKGEPRKAPTTPQEMMAEALRQMLEADKPESKPGMDQAELEKIIQREMEKRANVYRVEVKHNDPLIPDFKDEEKPRHEVFKEVLAAVLAGRNVLLVGPAGCGKTTIAQDIAKAAGLVFGFTGAVASEYKLLGFINAQGVLVRTQYRDAYEHGRLFLFDEVDASAAQAFLSFNAGLDNGFQDFPDTVIAKHLNFRTIASANTYGHGADRQYVGRNQMDAASLDRFYTIPMDYDSKLEQALFGSSEWVLYVQAARAATRKLGIRHVVSMRAIRDGLVMLKTGTPRVDVERGALWKHLPKEDVHKIKSAMVGA